VKLNITVSALLGESGPPVIVVTGGATIVHVRVAGVPSVLPARSTERTLNVCSPGSRLSVCGESHGSNGRPSTEHSNASSRSGVALSEPKNSNVASASPVRSGGPERIPVPGVTASATAVHVWTAGVGSTLPSKFGFDGSGTSGSASSIARTSNVCSPGAICGSA
jgi:hypothetical protein